MIKKTMDMAEVMLIHLSANDTICTSVLGTGEDPASQGDGVGGNNGDGLAPSRFNYRGAEMGCEDNEW